MVSLIALIVVSPRVLLPSKLLLFPTRLLLNVLAVLNFLKKSLLLSIMVLIATDSTIIWSMNPP